MGVNVVTFDGRTLIDLREDSVTPQTLAVGATAHDRAGNEIVGVFVGGSSGGAGGREISVTIPISAWSGDDPHTYTFEDDVTEDEVFVFLDRETLCGQLTKDSEMSVATEEGRIIFTLSGDLPEDDLTVTGLLVGGGSGGGSPQVDVEDGAVEGSTKPITSGAVYALLGDLEAVLGGI